jgi:hypothetical protein
MTEEIDPHVLRKYSAQAKLGKGVRLTPSIQLACVLRGTGCGGRVVVPRAFWRAACRCREAADRLLCARASPRRTASYGRL